MRVVDVDVSETTPWQHGLVRLVEAQAGVSVEVEGLKGPIDGVLVEVTPARGLVLEQPDDDGGGGSVVWVPLDRVVLVTARYRRTDAAAERRARVELDDNLLARLRELAEEHADRTRTSGRKTISGVMLRDVVDEFEGHYDVDDLSVAFDVLRERGEMPGHGSA